MRQIDDAQIDAKLTEIENNFNSVSKQVEVLKIQLKDAEAELNRLQGDHRTWTSFKGLEAARVPAEAKETEH